MNTHAGGIATGTIMCWPQNMKVKPGTIDHNAWHIVDIMPTVLDAVGETTKGGHAVTLYNYAKDRAESTDVAAKHPDQVTRLRKLWDAWAKRVEANDKAK
jgi:arylsulfatase A-like enzyme